MTVDDLDMIVKTLRYAYEHGQLEGYAMAVEEDGSATLYPQGKWKDKIILRVRMIDDMIGVLGCSPKDPNNFGGEAARDHREAWDILRQYLELYGG